MMLAGCASGCTASAETFARRAESAHNSGTSSEKFTVTFRIVNVRRHRCVALLLLIAIQNFLDTVQPFLVGVGQMSPRPATLLPRIMSQGQQQGDLLSRKDEQHGDVC